MTACEANKAAAEGTGALTGLLGGAALFTSETVVGGLTFVGLAAITGGLTGIFAAESFVDCQLGL